MISFFDNTQYVIVSLIAIILATTVLYPIYSIMHVIHLQQLNKKHRNRKDDIDEAIIEHNILKTEIEETILNNENNEIEEKNELYDFLPSQISRSEAETVPMNENNNSNNNNNKKKITWSKDTLKGNSEGSDTIKYRNNNNSKEEEEESDDVKYNERFCNKIPTYKLKEIFLKEWTTAATKRPSSSKKIRYKICIPPREYALIFDRTTFKTVYRTMEINIQELTFCILDNTNSKITKSSSKDVITEEDILNVADNTNKNLNKYMSVHNIINIDAKKDFVLILTVDLSKSSSKHRNGHNKKKAKNKNNIKDKNMKDTNTNLELEHSLNKTIIPGDKITEFAVGKNNIINNNNKLENDITTTTTQSNMNEQQHHHHHHQLEITFESSYEATLFQYYILVLQMYGYQIINMFTTLEVIHQWSLSYYSNNKNDAHFATTVAATGGVAFDDIRRCLGSFIPFKNWIYEIYKLFYEDNDSCSNPNHHHRHHNNTDTVLSVENGLIVQAATTSSSSSPSANNKSSSSNNHDSGKVGGCANSKLSMYSMHRLTLSLSDFFQFICLPFLETNTPYKNPRISLAASSLPTDNNSIHEYWHRLQSFLKLRKCIACASAYIRDYSNAMYIVYKGWHIDTLKNNNNNSDNNNETEEKEEETVVVAPSLQKRLYFDDNTTNILHDFVSTNEYYEGLVGYDVLLQSSSSSSSSTSTSQGYTLVACHWIEWDNNNNKESTKLHYTKDPVKNIPSLYDKVVVNSNDDNSNHFFIISFFVEKIKKMLILLFVRTLPKGIHEKFDTCVNDFIKGDKKVRDEKLTIYLQLGPSQYGLSALAWAGLKGMSKLTDWSFHTNNNNNINSDEDDYNMIDIPTINTNDNDIDNDRTSFHGFNLSMYASDTYHFTGDNYISTTAYLHSEIIANGFIKYIYQSYIEKDLIPRNVIDLSFVLKGNNDDQEEKKRRKFDVPRCVLGSVRLVHVDPNVVAIPSESLLAGNNIVDNNNNDYSGHDSDYVPLQSVDNSNLDTSNDNGNNNQNIPKTNDKNEDFTQEIEALKEILSDITVLRKAKSKSSMVVLKSIVTNQDNSNDSFTRIPVLTNLTNNDLRRFYIASNFDLEACAIRIVNSISWRNITFPIDKRLCKIELQSGHCFYDNSSRDKAGNPIIYFRTMLKGIWRKDIDASILATLHRINTCFQAFDRDRNHDVKLTIIILLGYPTLDQQLSQATLNDEKSTSNDSNQQSPANIKANNILPRIKKHFQQNKNNSNTHDPQIPKKEEYTLHINTEFIQRITILLLQHYPERLAFAYIVQHAHVKKPSSKKIKSDSDNYVKNVWNKAGIKIKIRNMISSEKTRKKIIVLDELEDLKQYVDENELVHIAGGNIPIPNNSFNC